jgi:hypothetical protein
MSARARISAIDFWRGAVLVAILVDHIPGNGLEHFTPRNFGLSDSAEAFVFLSGLSVGSAYLGRAERDGLLSVTRSCARRALKLYGAYRHHGGGDPVVRRRRRPHRLRRFDGTTRPSFGVP